MKSIFLCADLMSEALRSGIQGAVPRAELEQREQLHLLWQVRRGRDQPAGRAGCADSVSQERTQMDVLPLHGLAWRFIHASVRAMVLHRWSKIRAECSKANRILSLLLPNSTYVYRDIAFVGGIEPTLVITCHVDIRRNISPWRRRLSRWFQKSLKVQYQLE